MGTFTVQAIVWNPHNPEKRLILGLVVDTGATYTILPASIPEKLGVTPIGLLGLG
jgi:predicted aspartyl protease